LVRAETARFCASCRCPSSSPPQPGRGPPDEGPPGAFPRRCRPQTWSGAGGGLPKKCDHIKKSCRSGFRRGRAALQGRLRAETRSGRAKGRRP
jgi:hypothetical protein